jgi:hypothetical protein
LLQWTAVHEFLADRRYDEPRQNTTLVLRVESCDWLMSVGASVDDG